MRARRCVSLVSRVHVSLLVLLILATTANAETLRVGILKVGASGPLYIAQDHSYFSAEGLAINFINLEAGQAVAVALVSGDVDIGVTGLTASLYNLAAGGQIRVVAHSGLSSDQRFLRPGRRIRHAAAGRRQGLGYQGASRGFDAALHDGSRATPRAACPG
jgi:ABC-type nitrate/sulfonate/bicarbonate transport system substrate-binding protein